MQFFGTIKKLVRHKLFILSMITMILCCIVLVDSILSFDNFGILRFQEGYMLGGLGFVGLFSFFYFTLILRVYVTFKHYPQYSLSRNVMTCIGMCIFLVSCCIYTLWFITHTFKKKYFNDPPKCDWILNIIVDILIIPWNIFVLYLFLNRFYRMILNMDESFQRLMLGDRDHNHTIRDIGDIHIDLNTNNNNDDMQNDDNTNHARCLRTLLEKNQSEQMEIVDLMAKITLLTIIEQLLFLVWLISVTIQFVLKFVLIGRGYNDNSGISLLFQLIEKVFWSLDICFICFLLHFTFIFNQDHYTMWCNGCHKRFKRCCIRCVVKKTLSHRVQHVRN